MSESTTTAQAHWTGPDALRALLEASATLLATSTVSGALTGILDVARSVIEADACAVWRTQDGFHWRMLESRGLSSSYRAELDVDEPSEPVLEAIPDVSCHPMLDGQAETYRAHGIRSMLVVPLKLRRAVPESRNVGTITFYWRETRVFSELDIAYASALANLSAAALNMAELQEQNVRETTRLAFLADASSVLASSLDYETTLERVAHLAVPHIADWCTVHVVEHGVPNRLVVAHSDPGQLAFAEEYATRYPERIEPDRGLGLTLRTGQAEVIMHVTEEMLAAATVDEEHLKLIRQLRISGSILVALRGHDDRVLGAIRLLATGERTFREADVRLAEDLARRAAAAIENAQLHREVLDQENRLRLAHAAAHMGTWSMDLVRNEIHWSEEWKRLHRIPSDTVPNAALGRNFVHPEEQERVADELAAALASGDDLVAFEHRAVLGDGSIAWIHHRARIERDAKGRAMAIMGISMDITDRRQAEDALRRTEKLAAAGRLAATVAHEINNPLEAIVNLIYIAKTSPDLPAEVAEVLTTAEGELNRTAQIVRQTLGFYRESVHPRESDVGRIVTEILDVYRSRIQARSLKATTAIEPGLTAKVIPGELKQVLANLISNALDASAPGGGIHVAVSRSEEDVLICVSDCGTGIGPDHLPHLFEPFFTTKSDVGTGLGLWVSKGIVEKHQGTLAVTTSVGENDHGSCFTVKLPLSQQSAAS